MWTVPGEGRLLAFPHPSLTTRVSEMFPCKTRSRLSRFPRNCTKIHENCFAMEFLYICNITSRSQQHALRPDIYKIFHRKTHYSENLSTDAFRGSSIGKHSPPPFLVYFVGKASRYFIFHTMRPRFCVSSPSRNKVIRANTLCAYCHTSRNEYHFIAIQT